MMADSYLAIMEEVLASDDSTVVYEMWDRITGVYDWHIPELPERGSCAHVVGDVVEADFHIGEAGFYALFTAETFDLTTIPDSYAAIGATETANLIREAFASLPASILCLPPVDRRKGIPRADTFAPTGFAGDLSLAYCGDHHDNVVRRLAQYCRDNRIHFEPLFKEIETFRAEAAREHALEQEAAIAVASDYLARCEAFLRALPRDFRCPRCHQSDVEFRCVKPRNPTSRAYFICQQCGRSFKYEDVT